jgi:hypothetical protein
VVLSYFLLHETGKVISFSAAEVDGTEYMRSLRKGGARHVISRTATWRAPSSPATATTRGTWGRRPPRFEADFKALSRRSTIGTWECSA